MVNLEHVWHLETYRVPWNGQGTLKLHYHDSIIGHTAEQYESGERAGKRDVARHPVQERSFCGISYLLFQYSKCFMGRIRTLINVWHRWFKAFKLHVSGQWKIPRDRQKARAKSHGHTGWTCKLHTHAWFRSNRPKKGSNKATLKTAAIPVAIWQKKD